MLNIELFEDDWRVGHTGFEFDRMILDLCSLLELEKDTLCLSAGFLALDADEADEFIDSEAMDSFSQKLFGSVDAVP
jgi:hypothetical protein